MRNLFDQYSQHENRLTHALLSCLQQDRKLLERFIYWAVDERINGKTSSIYEQSWPGEVSPVEEDVPERKGLPDGCIESKEGWLLLIECKFSAKLTADQITRHIRTAKRRGYDEPSVLVLTAVPEDLESIAGIAVRQWAQVYSWLVSQRKKSKWAMTCLDYMEVAEVRAVNDHYLKEGALTMFSGIPFGPDEPYSYFQAKRILGLLRTELQQDKVLQKRLNIDPTNAGRGAITGRQGNFVWDYLSPKWSQPSASFTAYPHFTLGIHVDRLDAYVTIPNGVKRYFRERLLGENFEQFESLMSMLTTELEKALSGIEGAKPMVILVQRHYRTQRSAASVDCMLQFDPRTAFVAQKKSRTRVKTQPQWLRATYEALSNRRSNLQFQIGAQFAYDRSDLVGKKEIKKVIGDVWVACSPLMAARPK